jgi:AcrR family transcriptional regulator
MPSRSGTGSDRGFSNFPLDRPPERTAVGLDNGSERVYFLVRMSPRRSRKAPGEPSKGQRTREHLFATAIGRFQEDGFEAATLRGIARDAGVTPALLYRYFDSKEALVAELYGRLLEQWSAESTELPAGTWLQRTLWLTRLSMRVLGPHRRVLRALLGSMLDGDPVASPLRNPTSVRLARPRFEDAVRGASDAPPDAEAVAEAAYLGHLALLFFWVVDLSPGQRATERLFREVEALAPWLAMGLKLPFARPRLLALAATAREGLGSTSGGEDAR